LSCSPLRAYNSPDNLIYINRYYFAFQSRPRELFTHDLFPHILFSIHHNIILLYLHNILTGFGFAHRFLAYKWEPISLTETTNTTTNKTRNIVISKLSRFLDKSQQIKPCQYYVICMMICWDDITNNLLKFFIWIPYTSVM